jgi:hypothetical protein
VREILFPSSVIFFKKTYEEKTVRKNASFLKNDLKKVRKKKTPSIKKQIAMKNLPEKKLN